MYYGLPTTFGGTYTEITAATKTPVQKDSSGAFLITKPFDTYGTTAYQFEFDVISRNFLKTDFVNNQVSVAVKGPNTFSPSSM